MELPQKWPVQVPKAAPTTAKESVINHVVNGGIDDEGIVMHRARYYGYSPSQKSWEPR